MKLQRYFLKTASKLAMICAALTIIIGVSGCKKATATNDSAGNIFDEAVFIKGIPQEDGSLLVSITNPWDTTALLANYQLINNNAGSGQDGEAAQTASSDTSAANATANSTTAGNSKANATANSAAAIRLLLPLKRLIVYSAVHAALLTELGYADAIVGVADAEYIKTPEIRERLADGRIVNIGSSMEPSLEKIIALKPDAVLLSPFQNAGHGIVDKAGVPVIECADYMETTPLGRAEWSKFYAMLVEGIADSNSAIFAQTAQCYKQLAQKAATFKEKPSVITEMQDRGSWTVPGGDSYAARLLTDAGAVYPFSDQKSTGSIPMSYEKVVVAATNVDFWLVKSYGHDITLEDIAKNQQFNTKIKAYSHNGIYNANTMEVNLYEETPFHPDRLLADYVAIFHHTGDSLRYYAPVK
jgi:iron complex transport system substrate-binding protein